MSSTWVIPYTHAFPILDGPIKSWRKLPLSAGPTLVYRARCSLATVRDPSLGVMKSSGLSPLDNSLLPPSMVGRVYIAAEPSTTLTAQAWKQSNEGAEMAFSVPSEVFGTAAGVLIHSSIGLTPNTLVAWLA